MEKLTNEEAAAFLEAHAAEMGAEVTASEIMAAVATGRATIAKRQHGLAVVFPENDALEQTQMHLWLLYVAPEARGRGIGRRFVRELVQQYAPTRYAKLICFGPDRARFFGKCGLRIVERFGDEGGRTMEQWRG